MFAVVFDSPFVVFAFGCCVRCFVRMVLCSHVVVFDFDALLCSLFCSSPGCSVRCSVRNQCCVGCSARIKDVVFDVLFALEMLFWLCSDCWNLFDVRCSVRSCVRRCCCVRCAVRAREVNVVFDVR